MSREDWFTAIDAVVRSAGGATAETTLQIGIITLLLDIRDRLPPMQDQSGD